MLFVAETYSVKFLPAGVPRRVVFTLFLTSKRHGMARITNKYLFLVDGPFNVLGNVSILPAVIRDQSISPFNTNRN